MLGDQGGVGRRRAGGGGGSRGGEGENCVVEDGGKPGSRGAEVRVGHDEERNGDGGSVFDVGGRRDAEPRRVRENKSDQLMDLFLSERTSYVTREEEEERPSRL